MQIVNNVSVFGVGESFKASKYPFSTDLANVNTAVTDTIKKLAACQPGTGHDQFLTGIVVQFDLTFSNKAWVEMQRYHFIDFVSSQSTMHCISKMDIDACCNKYVTAFARANLEHLKQKYIETGDKEDYLRLLYNIPSGFMLTARMSTNYRQLKTIYHQRRTHRLPDWQMFCDWIETLPYAEVLITGKKAEHHE